MEEIIAIYMFKCPGRKKTNGKTGRQTDYTPMHERKGGRPNVCRACRKDVVFLQQNMAFVILNTVTYLANPNRK